MSVIFAIETSCDETAAAVVENGVKVLASSLASSLPEHLKTGGVIPEVAARKQVETITFVIDACLKEYGKSADTVDAVAVTRGPGLIGALLVGVETAKALSFAWG